MDGLLISIARRLNPRIADARARELAVGLANVMALLYSAPITVVALVWLAAATDVTEMPSGGWLGLAVVFPLIYAFRRLDFTSYVEIEPGLYGSFGGSFEDVVRWPAVLLFGPVALWLYLFWRAVRLVGDLRNSDLVEQRWGATRSFLIDAGGATLGAMLGLAIYHRLGGVHPPSGLSFQALEPAVYATVVRFLVPIFVSVPYLIYITLSPTLALPPESRRAMLRFTVFSAGWPLLVAPFTVFAAGLFAEKGLIAFLFFVGAALLASALAHKMSRAVENGARRTRELESLERLSRAIVNGPPDASVLPDLLHEHVGNMFAMSTVDIRLYPDRTLLHDPDYAEFPDEVVWDWIQATGNTFASPAGRELPWGGVPRSYGLILVPIKDAESKVVLGGIVIRKRVDPYDVSEVIPAARSLAAQIASALHGAEVYRQALEHMRAEEELSVAADMQASLMPHRAPDVPGWEFKALIDSAREASGDFIDLIRLPEGRWGVLVADVAGKGVAAALYMAMVRTLVRTYALERDDRPDLLMTAVNRRILTDTDDDSFVTMFYGVLDPATGRLVYGNAGHNAPFLFHTEDGGSTEELLSTGVPMGLLPDAAWEREEVVLRPGDRLLAYTDGVTDAQNEQEEAFGEERLLEIARKNLEKSPIEMRTAIFDGIKDFVGDAPQLDDITLLIVAREAA